MSEFANIPSYGSEIENRDQLEREIRTTQLELEHAQRELNQAELELASIQKPYFGAAPSEYQLLAEKHKEAAQAQIDLYTQRLNSHLAKINNNSIN